MLEWRTQWDAVEDGLQAEILRLKSEVSTLFMILPWVHFQASYVRFRWVVGSHAGHSRVFIFSFSYVCSLWMAFFLYILVSGACTIIISLLNSTTISVDKYKNVTCSIKWKMFKTDHILFSVFIRWCSIDKLIYWIVLNSQKKNRKLFFKCKSA